MSEASLATEIMLSDRAATHVKQFLDDKAVGLRVAVKSTGCSGYQYVVEAATAIGAHDTVFESNGVTIVVDKLSLPILAGLEMDYVRTGVNEAFQFNNPQSRENCGCGESFSV